MSINPAVFTDNRKRAIRKSQEATKKRKRDEDDHEYYSDDQGAAEAWEQSDAWFCTYEHQILKISKKSKEVYTNQVLLSIIFV